MKINVNELNRPNFTDKCRECEYCETLGDFEYCCGFVLELLQHEKFNEMKNKVIDYKENGLDVSVLNGNNLLFQSSEEQTVTIKFKTNLKTTEISRILMEIINNNSNFKDVICEPVIEPEVLSDSSQTELDIFINNFTSENKEMII